MKHQLITKGKITIRIIGDKKEKNLNRDNINQTMTFFFLVNETITLLSLRIT